MGVVMNRGDRIMINDTFPIESMIGSFGTIIEVYRSYAVIQFDEGTPIADHRLNYNLMKCTFEVVNMADPTWEV